MKRVFAALLILTAFAAQAQIQPSDSIKVSLLTCGPGQELYSAFGHTGIRVIDYKNRTDRVYNYGTFDDQQPLFYPHFVQGQMIYSLSVNDYSDFMVEYVEEHRAVDEQDLNLTLADKQRLVLFLDNNALPQNSNYKYDFFWDNCATRPRDVFERILGSRLVYTNGDNCGFAKNKTMHDMLRLYVHDRPWVDFGFDLILGLPCEAQATPRNQTFLPDYLAKLFDCATVDGKPLVTAHRTLLEATAPKIDAPLKPMHITLALMFLGFFIILMERRRQIHYFKFDFILFSVSGLFGIFFLCLWAFTTHYSLPKNLNTLWLMPTHFIVAFFLLKKEKPRWIKFYFVATYIILMALLLGWKYNPQPINIAFAPLMILLAARSITIVTYEQKYLS